MQNPGPFRSGPTPGRNVLEAAVVFPLALALALSLTVPTTERYLEESRSRVGVDCAQFGAPLKASVPASALESQGAASLTSSVTSAAEDQAEKFKSALAEFLLRSRYVNNCEFPGFEPMQAYSWGGPTHGYAPFALCLLSAGVLGAAALAGYHVLRQHRRSRGLRGPLFGKAAFWLLSVSLVATSGMGVVLRLQLNEAWAHANAELEHYRVACLDLRDDLALSDALCTARSDACVNDPKFNLSHALKHAGRLEGVCQAPKLPLEELQEWANALDKQRKEPSVTGDSRPVQPSALPLASVSGPSEAPPMPPALQSVVPTQGEEKIDDTERQRREEVVKTQIKSLRKEMPGASERQIESALRFAALGMPLALVVPLALLGSDEESKRIETQILERTYTQIESDQPVELSEAQKDELIELAKSDPNFKQMLQSPIFARSREAAAVLANRECALTTTAPARFCKQSTLQGAMSTLGDVCPGKPIDKEIVAFLECCDCYPNPAACEELNGKYKDKSNYVCPKK